MEERIKALSDYRLEKSRSNLVLSKKLLQEGSYAFALNRAYYAAFDAMRAVNALDRFDSSKHSGVIAHFNQYHVKTCDFDSSVSSIIRRASRLRERSDYEDFFEPDIEDTERTIEEVEKFIGTISRFLSNIVFSDIDHDQL